MKFIPIIIFFVLLSPSVFSQNSGYSPYDSKSLSDSGYYYTNAGLKVRAYIIVNFTGYSQDLGCTFIKVYTPGAQKKLVLKTNEVNAFTIGKDSFALVKSIRRSDFAFYEKDFARVVVTGKLVLYSHCQVVRAGSGTGGMVSTGTECFYFIQKDGVLSRLKKGDFKDNAENLFGDNPTLMNKINQKELGFYNIEQIVAEYNLWYAKTNDVTKPTE